MPGTTIGIKLNNGWAGTQSRTADAIIQNRIADGTIPFGAAVTLSDDNRWVLATTGDTAADIAGVAVREVI